jgi:PTS system glucitol/sorbitol-specific IIC component
MNYVVDLAKGFINLFQIGAETFISWMSGIVPLVLMLLVAMNALIHLIGEKKINRMAMGCNKNPVLRYWILPLCGSFMLGNPVSLSLGRFLPEHYKPSYVASAMQFCHTSNGLFPHINPGELFIWLGIANGVQQLGLNTTELAVRYFLVGMVCNFISGWATDFTTKIVEKQQNIRLSRELKLG